MIEIREGDFRSFFQAPLQVYGPDSLFVTPLSSELKAILDFNRNPFFHPGAGTIFSALRGGQPLGRIAVHVHAEANRRFAEQTCSFGYFDCADDVEVAHALLERARQFARSRGCQRLRGNMNLTANQEIGVVIEGHQHPPFLAQIYNPAHIPRLLESFGMQQAKTMTSFCNPDIRDLDADGLLADKQQALLKDPRFSSRCLDTARFDHDLEIIREVLNEGMQANYQFVPMTPEQARFQLGPVKEIVDPDLIRIASYDQQPVGVLLALPDYNPLLRKLRGSLWPLGWWHLLRGRKQIRDASAIIIMAKPAYQNLGILRILCWQLVRELQRKNYRRLGGTWIGDDNLPSLRSAAALGLKPYHRLAIYEMELAS